MCACIHASRTEVAVCFKLHHVRCAEGLLKSEPVGQPFAFYEELMEMVKEYQNHNYRRRLEFSVRPPVRQL